MVEAETEEYANDLDVPSYKAKYIYRKYFLHFIRLCALSGIRPNTNIKHKDITYTNKGYLTIKRSEKGLPTRKAIFKNEFIVII